MCPWGGYDVGSIPATPTFMIKKYGLLIGTAVTFSIISAGGVFLYISIKEIKNENATLRSQIQDTDTTKDSSQFETISTSSSESSSSAKEDDSATEVSELANKNSLGFENVAPDSNPKVKNLPPTPVATPKSEEVVEQPEQPEQPKQPESQKSETPSIVVSSIYQAAMFDDMGGTYGAYAIEFTITPQNEDIYIAKSTNSSLSTTNVALSHSIVGAGFSGLQSDNFKCSNLADGLCKFKNDGIARTMTFTIYLTPDEEGSGSYGILFETLNYYEGSVKKSLPINRKTASVQVLY